MPGNGAGRGPDTLLAHIAETRTGQTWPTLRRELDRIKLGTFAGPAGTFQQRTEITKPQRDLLDALKLAPPPRIYQHTPPAADRHEPTAVDTRRPTSRRRVSAGQPPTPRTIRVHHLRNLGFRVFSMKPVTEAKVRSAARLDRTKIITSSADTGAP
ncbi:hypothetical protein ABZ904_22230 [Streptomyces sp. NPDC046900]|uniref:hypothetical protein n=1 Tax=Streptomyces sp. NPDC046900 TaxID=3155473 RepID=UPI0033FD1ACC